MLGFTSSDGRSFVSITTPATQFEHLSEEHTAKPQTEG